MKSGITRRWLRGSLLVTVVVVLLAEAFLLYISMQSYYGSVQQGMTKRFSAVAGQLQMYTGEDEIATASARNLALRRMVEQFGDKNKYEFMILDSYGIPIATSSGTDAKGVIVSEDFTKAQQAADGIGSADYRSATGEHLFSVCCIVPYAAQDIVALRLVTSLTLVDVELSNFVVGSIFIGALIIGFSVFSGIYFVRSIVVPLGQVERTAAAIAQGNFLARLPEKGDRRDEVDRLRITINHMAEGLAETEQIKNEFISSVSHELRTPLTSIKGWVETISDINDPTDENYRKGLAIIANETDRLYDMVEELLDFSRLQNGGIKMKCQPLDLVAELTDAVLVAEARVEKEGLVLDYEEPEMPIPVYADPNRLRQVFINILDNAVKYSAFGGKITVKIWQGKYKAFVEVIDQGRGISPEDLLNVKTKFFKGKNSVRGSGIGLALVDEIMAALDGSVDLNSTLGKGTVVTLSLPVYKK